MVKYVFAILLRVHYLLWQFILKKQVVVVFSELHECVAVIEWRQLWVVWEDNPRLPGTMPHPLSPCSRLPPSHRQCQDRHRRHGPHQRITLLELNTSAAAFLSTESKMWMFGSLKAELKLCWIPSFWSAIKGVDQFSGLRLLLTSCRVQQVKTTDCRDGWT